MGVWACGSGVGVEAPPSDAHTPTHPHGPTSPKPLQIAIFAGEPYLTCHLRDPWGVHVELYSAPHERVFANRGERTWKLVAELDRISRQAGGAVYPAKDARMSAENFAAYFPQLERFKPYVDPAFSSSFWRRVAATPAKLTEGR